MNSNMKIDDFYYIGVTTKRRKMNKEEKLKYVKKVLNNFKIEKQKKDKLENRLKEIGEQIKKLKDEEERLTFKDDEKHFLVQELAGRITNIRKGFFWIYPCGIPCYGYYDEEFKLDLEYVKNKII